MNKVAILLLMLISPLALSCVELPPEKRPVLEQFSSVILMYSAPTDVNEGEAEALLSIDEKGRVTKAELLSVKPESLDKAKILKAIEKAKFSVSEKLEGYTHIFEFRVLRP